MVLLGDEVQLEACFGPFRDTDNLDARLVHGLCRTYYRLENHFGLTQWNSKETRLKWKLDAVRLEILLILMQDRCMICAERTIGSDVVLDTPNGTPR